jgi:putative phosphoribosyl transferase
VRFRHFSDYCAANQLTFFVVDTHGDNHSTQVGSKSRRPGLARFLLPPWVAFGYFRFFSHFFAWWGVLRMIQGTKWTGRQVEISDGQLKTRGILRVPPRAQGVVAFAHGSGSGRFSPRNQFVARALEKDGSLATLLLDLLEEEEAEDWDKVFDVELLAERLQSAAKWLSQDPATRALRLGYFGASTGAGAALVAAARNPTAIAAVVSRGGRPDLAVAHLSHVQAPTLLIVGGKDDRVIDLNEQAFRQMRCPKDLVIVPGATHLFEEQGTLEEVARLAKDWFVRYLSQSI